MKKCKENYIKILTAMRDNSRDVAKIFEKDGNTEAAQKEYSEAYAYQVAIWLGLCCRYYRRHMRVHQTLFS